MKKYILGCLILFSSLTNSFTQTWQSINYNNISNTVPFGQFIINQYNNDIWIVNDNKVAVIENSGTVQFFDYNDLGTLWTGDHLRFCFTPDSIFYMLETIGLMNFNNYVSSQIFSETNILEISTNIDTVYLIKSGTVLQYINGEIIDTYYSASDIIAKNSYLYSDNGILGHKVGFSNQILMSDPQYLLASINDKKFQHNTDTIFVGTTKGIMYAFNYDILDTITPNNTFNMPSPNVLELEFDAQDSLWAVFGDVNNDPFAIAKLEGDAWTSKIDNTNSPIDFSTFLGLEIDTLGNLWVADLNNLHTLLTPNSPQWLSLTENEVISNLSLSPNPSSEQITIKSQQQIDEVQIVDLQGRTVYSTLCNSMNPSININELKPGNYFVKVSSGIKSEYLKFIKH